MNPRTLGHHHPRSHECHGLKDSRGGTDITKTIRHLMSSSLSLARLCSQDSEVYPAETAIWSCCGCAEPGVWGGEWGGIEGWGWDGA